MDTLSIIKSSKIIAIARGIYGEDLLEASLALYNGGVRAFEVTFEQDKALVRTTDAIAQLSEKLPDNAAVGAGTVMDCEQVEIAHNAGAGFIISPNTDPAVIERTKRLGMVSIPGAMTPTEIAYAYCRGADIVKVFPAGVLGIEYFKAVKAPLKHIALAAVAGITTSNIKEFYDAGAIAFGISSSLYHKEAIIKKDFAKVTDAARAFYDTLKE